MNRLEEINFRISQRIAHSQESGRQGPSFTNADYAWLADRLTQVAKLAESMRFEDSDKRTEEEREEHYQNSTTQGNADDTWSDAQVEQMAETSRRLREILA